MNRSSRIKGFYPAGYDPSKHSIWENTKVWNANSPNAGFLSNIWNSIKSGVSGLFNRATGADLTPAEQAANAFTAQQNDIAWQREMEASNTAYQRKVSDLQAAGLNPVMAVSSGVQLPSASAGSSVSPSSMAFQLPQLMQMYKSMKMMDAETASIRAVTAKTNAETSKISSENVAQDLLNKFIDVSEKLRTEGLSLSNQLTKTKTSEVYKQIDLIESQMKLLSRQADTEVERKSAVVAERLLHEASAKQILEMLPYSKALSLAQTESQKEAALLSAANAAYQNGLISSGYIEAQLRSLDVNADNTELRNAEQAVKTAFRTGKMPEGYEDLFSKADKWTLKNILMPFNNVLENLNPLAGLIKIGSSL